MANYYEELIFTQKAMRTATGVLLGIQAVILTPLCLYFCYNLWKLNKANILFFSKRHPKIVLCNVILFNIYILIIRNIGNYLELYFNNGSEILYSILAQSAQIPIVFICIRLWLLYYDYTSAMLMMNAKWKAEILKDDVSKPWTSKYRWLGDPKVVTFIGCLFATIVIFLVVSMRRYYALLQAIPVLYVLFLIIMMIKIRSCRDQFYIRNEFIVCMLWLIGCFLVYILIYALVPTRTTLRFVVMNIFVAFASYSICFISTFWILIQYKKQQHMVEMDKNTKSSSLRLTDIFNDEDRFELFAHHLIKEFSIENLTFILEMMQIKQQVITHKLLDANNVGLVVVLPSGTIKKVKRKNAKIRTVHELKDNIKYMMNEYVYGHSEHCINIASKTRRMILNTYNELEEEKINDTVEDLVERNLNLYTGTASVNEADRELAKKYASIMDEAITEISSLMQKDSLLRFAMDQRESGTLHKMSTSLRLSLRT